MAARPHARRPTPCYRNTKLSQDSRRLASASSLKVDGIISSPENRAFYASRGIDLDKLILDDLQASDRRDQPSKSSRRPQYSPIAPAGEIRIFSIEPAGSEEPLRCRLQCHSLQEPHSHDPGLAFYDALSYTWNAPLKTHHYTKGPPQPDDEFRPQAWLASALAGNTYTLTDGKAPASFEQQPGQVDERKLMKSVEVIIDGKVCDITGNLAAPLRHLRLPDHPRNLWIDAICIDQQNLQERSEQVSQMDIIYQSADSVHIWLGPAADGSDRAMTFAQAIWQYAHIAEADPIELFQLESAEARMSVLAVLEALTVLCMQPWFSRRWVVRELAFARNAIVHCGQKTITWQRFAHAVAFLKRNRLQLTYMRIADLCLKADPKTYRRGYLNTLAAESLTELTEAVVRRLPSPATHPVFQRTADLVSLLSRLAPLQCTDPLDTIYALLAIVSDATDLVIGSPDYTKSVADRYGQVVLRIIETKHSLNILCRHWAAVHAISSLPTWIQSYRPAATRHEGGADITQERRSFSGSGHDFHFHAAGLRKKKGTTGKMTDYEGIGTTLMVTGLVLDVIDTVGEGAYQDIPASWTDVVLHAVTPPQTPEDQTRVRDSLDAFILLSNSPQPSHHQPPPPDDPYATLADLITAGSRKAHTYTSTPEESTLCAALFAPNSPYRSTNSDRIDVLEVRGDGQPALLHHPTTGVQLPAREVRTFLASVASTTHNRAVARTVAGHLALVDAHIPRAEPGDVIVVPIGCVVPVVLRPKAPMDFEGTMSHGVFEFVGEAYVQGFMHGEAFELAGEILWSGGRRHVGAIFLVREHISLKADGVPYRG